MRGLTSYQYDPRDRVTQVSHPEGWVVKYEYDAAGNRTSVITRSGTAYTCVMDWSRAFLFPQ